MPRHHNITRLYQCYRAWLKERYPNSQPVKEHYYRYIFCTEYNISFCPPQKDVCDVCSLHEKNLEVDDEFEGKFQAHIIDKDATYEERAKDRNIQGPQNIVLSVDMEQVFSIPKMKEKITFYYHKISSYNLTGVTQEHKDVFCITWNECQSGRSASVIASALYKMIECLLQKYQTLKNIIIWLDNCASQNK